MTKVGIYGRLLTLMDVIILHGNYIYGHNSNVNGSVAGVAPINGISQVVTSEFIANKTQSDIGNAIKTLNDSFVKETTADVQMQGDGVAEMKDYNLTLANNERSTPFVESHNNEHNTSNTVDANINHDTKDWNKDVGHTANTHAGTDIEAKATVVSKLTSELPLLLNNTRVNIFIGVNHTSVDVTEQVPNITSYKHVDGRHTTDTIVTQRAATVSTRETDLTKGSRSGKHLPALNIASLDHTHDIGHRVEYEVPFQHHLSLVPMEDEPFGRLIWKNQRYLVSVLIPIGIGLVGAVAILITLYMLRCIARRSQHDHRARHTPVISSIESQTSGDRAVLITGTMEEDF